MITGRREKVGTSRLGRPSKLFSCDEKRPHFWIMLSSGLICLLQSKVSACRLETPLCCWHFLFSLTMLVDVDVWYSEFATGKTLILLTSRFYLFKPHIMRLLWLMTCSNWIETQFNISPIILGRRFGRLGFVQPPQSFFVKSQRDCVWKLFFSCRI